MLNPYSRLVPPLLLCSLHVIPSFANFLSPLPTLSHSLSCSISPSLPAPPPNTSLSTPPPPFPTLTLFLYPSPSLPTLHPPSPPLTISLHPSLPSIFADVVNVSAFALVICYGIRSFHGFSHLSAFTGLSNAPMALGVAVYAFEGVGMTLPLEASMKQPSRFPSVLALGLGIISVTYAVVGLAGYVGYGEETQEIITLNLPPGWPSEAVKLGICAALFFTFPVMMHPVHEIYERRLYLSPWVQRHVLSNNALRRTLFRSLRSLAVLAVALVAVGL
ncbi:unnamed protein product [Closterium sp. Naga37s-1]|nr:unnamed protein product [Closterium sp. Naga37s-1]